MTLRPRQLPMLRQEARGVRAAKDLRRGIGDELAQRRAVRRAKLRPRLHRPTGFAFKPANDAELAGGLVQLGIPVVNAPDHRVGIAGTAGHPVASAERFAEGQGFGGRGNRLPQMRYTLSRDASEGFPAPLSFQIIPELLSDEGGKLAAFFLVGRLGNMEGPGVGKFVQGDFLATFGLHDAGDDKQASAFDGTGFQFVALAVEDAPVGNDQTIHHRPDVELHDDLPRKIVVRLATRGDLTFPVTATTADVREMVKVLQAQFSWKCLTPIETRAGSSNGE